MKAILTVAGVLILIVALAYIVLLFELVGVSLPAVLFSLLAGILASERWYKRVNHSALR